MSLKTQPLFTYSEREGYPLPLVNVAKQSIVIRAAILSLFS